MIVLTEVKTTPAVFYAALLLSILSTAIASLASYKEIFELFTFSTFENFMQLPMHVCPFQEKPLLLHSQLNEPLVLVQFAVSSHV